MYLINVPNCFFELIYLDVLLQTLFYYQNDEILEYELEKIVDCINEQYLTK